MTTCLPGSEHQKMQKPKLSPTGAVQHRPELQPRARGLVNGGADVGRARREPTAPIRTLINCVV